ncbi:MAG TPA: hypothetical protein VFC63_16130 [Blastocatellia bacterium]|nr:hypothetical protein [Blastocatellia bacterium]
MQDEKAVTTLISLLNEARATRRQAQLRLEQHEQEIKRLRQQIADADATIRQTQTALQAFIGDLFPDSMLQRPDSNNEAAPETTRSQPQPEQPISAKPAARPGVEVKSARFTELNIPQAALIVLRESGGPLHVNELYNRMLENGFHFGGDNHLISLSVSLSRNRRFRKVGPGTFDLVMRDAGQVA